MASSEVLDFSKLLAPFAGANAVGVDLRADPSPVSDLYTIKGARSTARDAERRQMHDVEADDAATPGAPPDWRPVLDKGVRVLAEKSKDLEITAYLIEALVRQHGFAGLRDGFRLARELVERYWDGLYPLPDEDGLERRLAPLVGLNGEGAEGTLAVPIAMVPFTGETSHGRLSLIHYQKALSLNKIPDNKTREKQLAKGAVSIEILRKAVGDTPAEFYKDLVEDLTQSAQEFSKLCEALGAKCNGDVPPSSNIRSALESYLDVIKEVAEAKLKPSPSGTGATDHPAVKDGTPIAPAEQPSGVIQSREDALKTLLKVADFFRRTEPHSVLSYTLEQVVGWGRMPLPELLSELIPEDGPRKSLFKQVGIRPPEPAPKETAKK